MAQEFIYALYHWVDGKQVYFYVGRSEREVGVRFNEHRYAVYSDKPQFKTDVYEYIRNHVQCCIFDEEILDWCREEAPEVCEDYYVIKLIRDGHELQNEKHGDAKRIALMEEAYELETGRVRLNSPTELRKYREHKKSEELRRKVLEENGLRPHIQEIVNRALPTREEKELAEKKRIAKAQRRLAAETRYQEHLDWLEQQQHLFEAGEIDALGNRLPK